MSNSVLVDTALRLPSPDIKALIQGRAIASVPRIFIEPEQSFALYPSDASINLLPTEQHYRSDFLPIAQTALAQLVSKTVSIKAWARCELCQILNDAEGLEALSRLTVWTVEALHKILSQRGHIFLTYLRVYQLPQPIEVPVQPKGQFVPLPYSLTVSESLPVLSDRVFAQRRHQLEKRQPPTHPELEELQSASAQLADSNPGAEELDQDIKIFLGWSSYKPVKRLDIDLPWIKKIAEIGNSSDGQTFEKLVRRGLLELGFRGSGLAPDSTGGASGMDFYCETPYPMVGECKATKTEKVPDGTPAQLLKIGMNHLGKAQYDRSIKLIIAAGELNFYALRTVTENQMNVIRPETLQKIVEMQARYKGSINLLEMKQCLQQAPFGLADDKVNDYIDKVRQDIKVRSHLTQVLKKYQEDKGLEAIGVERLCGVYDGSNPPKLLSEEELHEILIELSSPLTGYLGRIKGIDWQRDRFYFLRDLPIS